MGSPVRPWNVRSLVCRTVAFVLGQVPQVDVETHSMLFAHHVVELVELYLFGGSVPLRVLLSSRAPLRRWFRQCGSTVIDARRPVVMAQ